MTNRITLLLAFVLSFLFLPGYAQELEWGQPKDGDLSAEKLAQLNAKMQAYIDENKLGGIATMIARKDKIVQCETFGYQHIEKERPVEKNSIFRIFSMTKPVTAVALMILYEEGKFKLDDPVSDYIPEFKDLKVYENGQLVEVTNPMTVRHLLTHTSGLSYGWNPSHVDTLYGQANIWEPGTDLKEFTRKISKLPLNFQPGSKWLYGVSTDIAGYLVEVLSGQTLDDFFRERIFDPLGMEDTGFYVPEEKHHRLMEIYRPDRQGGIEIVGGPYANGVKRPPVLFSGGGGLMSTLSDYMRFSQMLLSKGVLGDTRILKRKTVAMMTKDHMPAGVQYTPNHGFGFAMEVMKEDASGDEVGSSGSYRWSGLANTYFWIDPQEDLIGMVFTQFLPYGFYPIFKEFKAMVYEAIED